MPSERERWITGPERNTIGHTDGATGPVTGGVKGHVKSEPQDPKGKRFGGDALGAQRHPPNGGKVQD